ncbi:TlpA disulfide reductase family protein [uncultured Polaribacter sp.]|uniref:TlpA disulfide reductase family protein n=1 Tax=uncultured Polaribacter sp. TaxID=174711 RepID=UPI00262DE559|nr:TlpA disulfide reductase family protein [uncultured Polaribacter sp.]
MKKLLAFIFLISSFAQAQFTINGTLTHSLDTDWVILYSIEGSRQLFVQNTNIKKDSVVIDGKSQAIGTFQFTLPLDTKIGSYRIKYRTTDPGFVDFIFNKENVSFTFHPDYPEQTVLFSESKENILYKNYLIEISAQQQKLDSLQVVAFRDEQLDLEANYKKILAEINSIQTTYLDSTKEMYVQPFIKATLRANPSEIKTTPKEYLSNMRTTFFDNMDFANTTLLNSSFLVDRITDYVFYINYSEDQETQQKLYKESIETVFSKIKDVNFKKDVIEFLIGQFEENKNVEMIDHLFDDYYNKLPKSLQSEKFKSEKLTLLATEIGRTAPNFSWKENGETLQLATLKDAKNYVLVFWSTDCSHCLKEIPELYQFLQEKNNIKVVAFSLERNDFGWKNMKKTLPNWRHILGLNKWENKIARTYNINATPTYFVLNADKEIIAKPDELKELKAFLEKL